jgi:hypothetical protein
MEKETIEIHNTEYVDRELPTITYDRVITTSMTESERTHISISDKTSKAALETFEKVRKDVK